MGSFSGAATTPLQDAWNKSMNQSVKRIFCKTYLVGIFGNTVSCLTYLDFKKGLKLFLIAFG